MLSELDLMKQLEPHLHVIKLLGCVTISGKYGKFFINSPFSSKSLARQRDISTLSMLCSSSVTDLQLPVIFLCLRKFKLYFLSS